MDNETDLDKPISISLEEEDTAAGTVQKQQPEPTTEKEKAPSPEEAVAELKQQLEAANSERERIAAQKAEFERRATEESNRADAAQAKVSTSEHRVIENAIEVVERDIKMARASYAAAMASGDYEAAADAQIALSEGAAKRLQLSNAKTVLEQRLEKTTEGRVVETPPRNADPVEQWASQLSPRSAKWIREHRDVVTDPAKSRRLSAAHNAAVDIEGLELDSDSYFSYIEQVMGYRRAEEPREPAHQTQKPRVIHSAPGSGATVSGTPRRSDTSITLSPAERETARALGMTEKEYAINKAALIKDGKLSA